MRKFISFELYVILDNGFIFSGTGVFGPKLRRNLLKTLTTAIFVCAKPNLDPKKRVKLFYELFKTFLTLERITGVNENPLVEFEERS